MNERLKQYMALNNVSRKQMAKVIGMSYNSFNRVLVEDRSLSAEYIEKILLYYTDLDARWLLTGVESDINNPRLVELLDDAEVLEKLSDLIVNKLQK